LPPCKQILLSSLIPIPSQLIGSGQIFKAVPYWLTAAHVIARSNTLVLTACNKHDVEYRPVTVGSCIRTEVSLQGHIDPQLFFCLADSSLFGCFININEATRERQFSAIRFNAPNTKEYFAIFNNVYDCPDGRVNPVLVACLADKQTHVLLGRNLSAFRTVSFHGASISFSERGLEPRLQIQSGRQNKKTPIFGCLLICNNLMVRTRGLEPPRVAPLPPQSSASTDSATSA
jgi:hypothetical protein